MSYQQSSQSLDIGRVTEVPWMTEEEQEESKKKEVRLQWEGGRRGRKGKVEGRGKKASGADRIVRESRCDRVQQRSRYELWRADKFSADQQPRWEGRTGVSPKVLAAETLYPKHFVLRAAFEATEEEEEEEENVHTPRPLKRYPQDGGSPGHPVILELRQRPAKCVCLYVHGVRRVL